MSTQHQTPPAFTLTHSASVLHQELAVTPHHRHALASLKLVTYALDAMRVLDRLEAQAQISDPFHQAIRQACPDWRNPGSLEEDPTDLLVSVMTHSVDTLQGLIIQLEEAWLEGPLATTITAEP